MKKNFGRLFDLISLIANQLFLKLKTGHVYARLPVGYFAIYVFFYLKGLFRQQSQRDYSEA